jgi:hypothetical protein
MGFFGRLANFVTRAGRDDNRLKQAMDLAHADRPSEAISIYDSLLSSESTSPMIRARTLFNRALAYSSLKDDAKAVADLQKILEMQSAPENVLSAARNQLLRVQNRIERSKSRGQR